MLEYIKNYVVKLPNKHEVVKALLYLKLLEKEVKITNNDLNVLALFVFEMDIKKVADTAIEKEYKLSLRSVENTISDLVEKKLLDKVETGKRRVNYEILPVITGSQLAVNCKIYNIGI